mgnify:CR=1 FL=1
MGTNYYWNLDNIASLMHVQLDDYTSTHIGKRSGAGLYCFKCKATLCQEGERAIHTGRGTWLTECFKCRKKVDTLACSFIWAYPPNDVLRLCKQFRDSHIIVNEYGERVTGGEFLVMLDEECPIQFHDSIGSIFS